MNVTWKPELSLVCKVMRGFVTLNDGWVMGNSANTALTFSSIAFKSMPTGLSADMLSLTYTSSKTVVEKSSYSPLSPISLLLTDDGKLMTI